MATMTLDRTNSYHVEASAVIDAPAQALYAVIADYKVGHPAILPKPYFTDLTVEKGGYGAGTLILVQMKVWGQKVSFRQMVTEPEPGRVIAETNVETGQITRFIFEPINGGSQTRVTIASEFPLKPGIAGWIEKLIQPAFIRRLYPQELKNLAEYVQETASRG